MIPGQYLASGKGAGVPGRIDYEKQHQAACVNAQGTALCSRGLVLDLRAGTDLPWARGSLRKRCSRHKEAFLSACGSAGAMPVELAVLPALQMSLLRVLVTADATAAVCTRGSPVCK